jgi:uncharacterized repeat protein (TIGR03803 family)
MKFQMRRLRLAKLVLTLAATIASASAQTYKVLHNFGSTGPANPVWSGVIAQGRDGNLYSGTPGNADGFVFKITPSGTLSVVVPSGTGGAPQGGLTLSTDGNFYGTNFGCSVGGKGTIFKTTASGAVTTLHTFAGGIDGECPTAPPIRGVDGNFYGTATQGGSDGFGTVYRITPSGTFTILHSFVDATDAASPKAPLVQGIDGNFYGTTEAGSPDNVGNVFKVTPTGTFKTLFDFEFTHGANPFAPLIQGSDGNFYGTAKVGGANGRGVVFKITPSGAITVLHSFNGSTDGAAPVGGLVQATDGNLYGTTSMATGTSGCGNIFRVSPSGSNFATLHAFPADGSGGCSPQVTLTQHTNGILYGDTNTGGTSNHGVLFSLIPSPSLPPFVSLLTYSGKVGATIEFLGQGFTSTSAVSFNGTSATRTVVSGTYLTATVPSGTGTGFVTVTTSSGTLKSNKIFRVIPQITGFSPASGPVGIPVTIMGVSLKQTKKVTFGGVAASFAVNSDSKVTATVPTGAVTGKIAITTLGGKVTSSGTFTVATASNTTVTLDPNSLSFSCYFTCFLGCHWSCTPPQTVTLTDSGSATLYITDITITGRTDLFSQKNTCGTSLGAKQSCSITVSGPGGILQCGTTYTGALAIYDTATGSPQTVALTAKEGNCP